jgi:glycerol-3-phosphate acyltransferase PlsX
VSITVALDAMGGDLAPQATVAGAIRAAEAGHEVALVGDEAVLAEELAKHEIVPSGVRIVHAPDVIDMHEQPSLATARRRGSSIYVGLELLKNGEAGAFVSNGNTGAVLALSLLVIGKLPGVDRPALAALIPPRTAGPTLLLDVGANAESRPLQLVQWGAIGAEYMKVAFGVANPKVGLLNIGEEPSKGSPLVVEANKALSQIPINFIGNIEGGDIARREIDVIVTDGFTGNVVLKLIEGMATAILGSVRDAASGSMRARLGGLLLMPAVRDIRQRFDYRQYGGAPLIGVNGMVLVGHGRSDVVAVGNAIATAATAAELGALDAFAAAVERSGVSEGESSEEGSR